MKKLTLNRQTLIWGQALHAPVSTVLDADDQAITWLGRMINDICPALKVNERQNKRSSLMSLDSCRILSISLPLCKVINPDASWPQFPKQFLGSSTHKLEVPSFNRNLMPVLAQKSQLLVQINKKKNLVKGLFTCSISPKEKRKSRKRKGSPGSL